MGSNEELACTAEDCESKGLSTVVSCDIGTPVRMPSPARGSGSKIIGWQGLMNGEVIVGGAEGMSNGLVSMGFRKGSRQDSSSARFSSGLQAWGIGGARAGSTCE